MNAANNVTNNCTDTIHRVNRYHTKHFSWCYLFLLSVVRFICKMFQMFWANCHRRNANDKMSQVIKRRSSNQKRERWNFTGDTSFVNLTIYEINPLHNLSTACISNLRINKRRFCLLLLCETAPQLLIPLRPSIKLQILLLCFHTFLTEVVGRSCWNSNRISLEWSCSQFSWPH